MTKSLYVACLVLGSCVGFCTPGYCQEASIGAGVQQSSCACAGSLDAVGEMVLSASSATIAAPEQTASRFRARALETAYDFFAILRSTAPASTYSEELRVRYFVAHYPACAAYLFSKEIAINPSSAAYNYRAHAYAHLSAYAQAAADYTKAIEKGGESGLYRFRAQAYLLSGDYDKALADIDQALIKTDKSRGGAMNYHDKALILYKKGAYAEAGKALEEFFNLNTDKNFAEMVGRSSMCVGLMKRQIRVGACVLPTGGEGGK